ncbi:MAG: hypothetical protein KF708_20720 [Pirellulales bacterium]|nr:hypothetical protein [Pirellulales bacterium]
MRMWVVVFGLWLALCAAPVAAQTLRRLPPVPPAPWPQGMAPLDGSSSVQPASYEQTCTSCSAGDLYCPRCHGASCQCPECPAPCDECPRINLINPAWRLMITGWLELDMLYNSARPVAPGVPFFLAPGAVSGNNQSTFDAHARQSALFAAFVGPQVAGFQTGGLVAANLFNDAVIVDRYGFLPYQAYGEAKNEDWRFAAGLQMDIFAPLLPTVLPFSYLIASGNAGEYRGQLRAERFLYPSEDRQITLTAGISDPRATVYSNQVLGEDAGWPNIELRAAYGLGDEVQVGLVQARPVEFGVSTVVGQIRTVIVADSVTANVWGLAGDFRWRMTERFGFAGEIFSGQGLGTYGAAVFQPVNSLTGESVHATGGWLELYYYFTPCVHTHGGVGIDDPVDDELSDTQIAMNRTVFANLIWDVSPSIRLGIELTFRDTNYLALNDNNGVGIETQTQWRF